MRDRRFDRLACRVMFKFPQVALHCYPHRVLVVLRASVHAA